MFHFHFLSIQDWNYSIKLKNNMMLPQGKVCSSAFSFGGENKRPIDVPCGGSCSCKNANNFYFKKRIIDALRKRGAELAAVEGSANLAYHVQSERNGKVTRRG